MPKVERGLLGAPGKHLMRLFGLSSERRCTDLFFSLLTDVRSCVPASAGRVFSEGVDGCWWLDSQPVFTVSFFSFSFSSPRLDAV